MTELYGFETGNLMHCIGTVGDVHITEEIYPLCGNTVQTTVGVQGSVVTVQPNTYTQRVTYHD